MAPDGAATGQHAVPSPTHPSTVPAGVLGVVVGMEAEAALIRAVAPHALIGISGATARGARAAVADLLGRGAGAILSFGLAAGLDPALRAGAVLVPGRVLLPDGRRLAADPVLLDWLGHGRPDVVPTDLAHSDDVIVTAGCKGARFRRTGCAGLDMESGFVAEGATRAGVPFAVLRVVCDPAGRSLPPAAVLALQPDGGIGMGRILASVLRHPSQIPALIALGRDAACARAQATAVLGDRFARAGQTIGFPKG
jgi:adenosylhomocysteine nucleosidase